MVRLIVGFPPGGGADSAARIAAGRLSEIWGQQVVVENKGGAGGNIAHDTAAHAAPDGYTMLFSPSSLPIMPMLYASLNYDPMADLMPISLLGKYPNLIVVSKDSPVNSLKEFIDNAKANPGKVTFATPGIGTTPHLTAELFKKMAGVDLTHVPYRGVAAGAMNDLITNRIDCMFNTTGSLLRRCARARCAGLAQSTPRALAARAGAADLRRGGRAGLQRFVVVWAVRAGQDAARDRGEDARQRRNDAERARDQVAIRGARRRGRERHARAIDRIMRSEIELWGPIVKAANIKGE